MGKNSLFKGLQVGGLIAGMQRVTKKPIAFLYNGVQLPPLPAWDKEAYPYAVINYYKITGEYTIYFAAPNAYCYENTFVYFGGSSDGEHVAAVQYTGTLEQGWYDYQEVENFNVCLNWKVTSWAIWSNTDLEYDGTLYLAASDPIPVYE